jgi:hypothetical protein
LRKQQEWPRAGLHHADAAIRGIGNVQIVAAIDGESQREVHRRRERAATVAGESLAAARVGGHEAAAQRDFADLIAAGDIEVATGIEDHSANVAERGRQRRRSVAVCAEVPVAADRGDDSLWVDPSNAIVG